MNPYEILGVKEHDSIEDIAKVFRNLAKKCHPDMSLDDKERKIRQEKFMALTEAYNEIKRLKQGKVKGKRREDC